MVAGGIVGGTCYRLIISSASDGDLFTVLAGLATAVIAPLVLAEMVSTRVQERLTRWVRGR